MTSFLDLHWGILEIIYLAIIFAIIFIVMFILSPHILKFLKKKGYVGYDIHKNQRPEVPESGGTIIVIGLAIGSVLLILFFPLFINEILIFLITIILSALIGFFDDRLKLRSFVKIILTLFTGSVIFIANYFSLINITSPTIPILGKLRLTVIYPLAAPLIVAVFANTVNMLEGYNGEGSGTCLIACVFILICAMIWDSAEAILFCIVGIAAIIPFFLLNRYPARAFPGDIGTLSMGSMIACIALFGSLEAAVFSALLIHIFNSFYVLSSVRGFLESASIQKANSDIILLEDDRIAASDKKRAVLTLPRLILARGPLTEPVLVKNIYIISIICGFFSIITTFLMLFSVGRMELSLTLLLSLIMLIPVIILSYYRPRIRGIIVLMALLLLGGCIFLIFIEIYIMPIEFEHLEILSIQIPINIILSLIITIPFLIIWYVITIKYFNHVVNKMKQSPL